MGIVNKVYLAEWKAVIYSMVTNNNDFKKKMNCCSWFLRLFGADVGGGGGGTPYDGLNGEAPQELFQASGI